MIDYAAKLYYPEPNKQHGDVLIWCTVREAIEWQRFSAKRARPGFTYLSDEVALEDFMAVHWASYDLKAWKTAPLLHMREKL